MVPSATREMQIMIAHIPALKSRHMIQKVDSETNLPTQSLSITLLNSLTISYVHATNFDDIHPSNSPLNFM